MVSDVPATPGQDSTLPITKTVSALEKGEGQEIAVETPDAQKALEPDCLAPWAVEEALRYFEDKLLLEVFRYGERAGDERAEICTTHFRSLVESWHPNSTTFWRGCVEFSKQWAPGGKSDDGCGSPRARALSAGRLSNYLTRLSRSAEPSMTGEVELCTPDEANFSAEVCSTAQRFGIRLSDIRCTSTSLFEACKSWTGLDWDKDHAADPCPWPVPPGFNGLRCSWKWLAAVSGHDRVYLNPPWSKLDQWLYKAVCECREGLPILAVVPSWMGKCGCEDIKQFASIIDQRDSSPNKPCRLDIEWRLLYDVEFAHPSTGQPMPPLNVMLIWLRCP